MVHLSRIAYSWLLAGAYLGILHAASGQHLPAKRAAASVTPPVARHPTLFPDTLHAQPLEVTYWSSWQVDSIQAALGTTRREVEEMVADSTARYRVFYSKDDYPALRLFYRPVAAPTRWIEFDLNPWLVYNMVGYMHAHVVYLNQQGPEEIMVKMGGGSYGSGYRTMLDQTLLVSIDGPPRLLWQCIDGRIEEIPPYMADKEGEMIGGNFATRWRTVAMRQGLVYVSPVKKKGKFENPEPSLTPITPGYYQYQAGHFRRVAPPKQPPKAEKPQPSGRGSSPGRLPRRGLATH